MEEHYLPWAREEKALKTYKREEQVYRIWALVNKIVS